MLIIIIEIEEKWRGKGRAEKIEKDRQGQTSADRKVFLRQKINRKNSQHQQQQ